MHIKHGGPTTENERGISLFGILESCKIKFYQFLSCLPVQDNSQYNKLSGSITKRKNVAKGSAKTLQPLAPTACCYKLIYGCTYTEAYTAIYSMYIHPSAHVNIQKNSKSIIALQ